MSNLNDFIGNGGMMSYYQSNGINSMSSHGSYDTNSYIQIVGQTSDTHSFAKEYKLHRVPGKRVFAYFPSNEYFWIKANTSPTMTGAPDPSGDWFDEANALPVANAVLDTLRFKISTKGSAGGTYSVVETVDFSSGVTMLWGNEDVNSIKSSSSSNFHMRWQCSAYRTTSQNEYWNGSSTSRGSFIRLQISESIKENIDECVLNVDSDNELWVKLEWTVDNTSWNSLFTGGDWTQELVEGIKFTHTTGHLGQYMFAGQREYSNYRTTGNGTTYVG